MMFKVVLSVFLINFVKCDVSEILEISTVPPPPKPYAFGYAAGRFPGHIDRTHSEISDGQTVQGSYSYVDPKFRIRTVDYIADKNGFHPVLNFSPPPLPKDTDAVAAARQRHFNQFNAIANAHQTGQGVVPSQTQAVLQAAQNHNSLYQKIAAEHARLAYEAKLEQEREAEEQQAYLDKYSKY